MRKRQKRKRKIKKFEEGFFDNSWCVYLVFFPEKKKKKTEVGKKRREGGGRGKTPKKGEELVVVENKHLKTKSELIKKSEIKEVGEG